MKSIFLGFSLTITLDVDVDDNLKIIKTVALDGNLSDWDSIPNTAIFTNHKN